MKTKIVLVANDPPVVLRDAITRAIREEGAGWWHWFQSAWLISDPHGRGLDWWRERVKIAAPDCQFLMFLAQPSQWTGFTSPLHYDWMYTVWNKDS